MIVQRPSLGVLFAIVHLHTIQQEFTNLRETSTEYKFLVSQKALEAWPLRQSTKNLINLTGSQNSNSNL